MTDNRIALPHITVKLNERDGSCTTHWYRWFEESVDRTIVLLTDKVDKITAIFAGAHLTGGGTLIGDVTLSVTPFAAWEISYDNSLSGLLADNVQEAIDEVFSLAGGGGMNPFYNSVAKPVAADFTVENNLNANHGTATLVDLSTRGVTAQVTLANAGVATQGFFYQPAVANTFVSVQAFFHAVWSIQSNWFFGVGIRDNAGQIHAFGLRNNTFAIFRYTDIGTFSGFNNFGVLGAFMLALPHWIKVENVAGNFEFSASPNGETWELLASVGETSFLGATINDVGIFVVNNLGTITIDLKVSCYSFSYS